MTKDFKTFALSFLITTFLAAVLLNSCGSSHYTSSETGSREEQSIEQLQKQPTDSAANGPLTPETRARTRPSDPQHTPRVTNIVNTDLKSGEVAEEKPCGNFTEEPCFGAECVPCDDQAE